MLRMFAGSTLRYENDAWIASSSPMAPARTSSWARNQSGWRRYMKASISATPASRQAAIMPAASRASIASGFSHSTCLPASAARRVHSAWRWLGRGM